MSKNLLGIATDTKLPKLASLYFPVMDNGCGTARKEHLMSMIALCGSSVLKGRKVIFDPLTYPYPDGNANIATWDFLESGCDEMVVVDLDVEFNPNHMAWLLSHDVGIIGGIIPKKQPGLQYSIIPLESNPDPFSGPNDLCEVEVVCRGFMRIKREVFELLEGHPDVMQYTCLETQRLTWEFWRNVAGGTSDDFNFCRRYRSMGGRVYVDRRCTVQHAGNVTYPIKGTY